MNMLLTTDGYHLTMGYLIGDTDAMEMETHVLYARTGGPLVVPNLSEMVSRYIQWRPTQADIDEADEFWTAQGVPFNREAAEAIAAMPDLPITIRGVKNGEVVQPGEPIAVIQAPAFMAAIPEPVFIGEMMTAVQVATRFTKTSKALNWDRSRVFEVGMRADRVANHIDTIKVLEQVGLGMSSSGVAAKASGIRAGGSMGHRYTQRFNSDYEAFMQAVDRMLAFKENKGMDGKVKLSFLLDTRNTLDNGLPDAMQVITERYEVIKDNIELSVRLDSGDLDAQLRVIIESFMNTFDVNEFMPAIIVESGLTASDIAGFEATAREMGFPASKMLYGQGGYLVGGISRDFVSMVYKVSSFGDTPTMKFGDEANRGKESYPGDITLMERVSEQGIERQIALVTEVDAKKNTGWEDVFESICINGKMIAQSASKEDKIARIEERWDSIGQGYIGDEKYPEGFDTRPQYSAGVEQYVRWIRDTQLGAAASDDAVFINQRAGVQ